jgi:methionine aminotransferase
MQNIYEMPKGSLISFMSNKVKQSGGINLAQGIPGFMPPKELLDCLSDIVYEPYHQYAAGNGDPELVEVIKDYHKQQQRLENDNVLVVQGATEALSLLYIYLNNKLGSGFATLAFDPVYESYKNLPPIFSGSFINYQAGDQGIDFNHLATTITENGVKLIFIGSPGNPYGLSLSESDLRKLLELSDELDFYIVFDAVYKDLYFNGKPYQLLDVNNKRLFYVNSFSKMLSITGWRIGYLVCDKDNMSEIRSIHDYTGLCAPALFQKALVKYLKSYNFGNSYLTGLRNNLIKNYAYLSSVLTELGFRIPKTDGGYFVWAELPEGYTDGFRFAIDLYEEHKVAVIPGIHFSDNCSSFIRVNIARTEEEIEAAVIELKKYFKK